jgi:hypothetical protein
MILYSRLVKGCETENQLQGSRTVESSRSSTSANKSTLNIIIIIITKDGIIITSCCPKKEVIYSNSIGLEEGGDPVDL